MTQAPGLLSGSGAFDRFNVALRYPVIRIATTFKKGRRKYTCVDFRDYTNRFGRKSMLAICRSRCASCDHPPEFMNRRTEQTHSLSPVFSERQFAEE